ncbi:MAG: O-antigen ligase family protein [Bacteroidota bacterium]
MALWLIVGMFFGPLYLIFIPITALLLLRKNYFLELLLGFWFILILSDSVIFNLSFAKTFKPIFILLVAFCLIVRHRDFFQFKNRIFLSFLPFIVWSFFVIAFSNDVLVCFQKTLSYSLILLVVPYFSIWAIENEKENFFRGVIWFGAFIIIGCLIYALFSGESAFLEGRFRGFFGNANAIGIFSMLLFIFFELSLSYSKGLFSKYEKWFLYFLILGILLYSQTRSAIFAVTIYLFFSRVYSILPIAGIAIIASIAFFYQDILGLLEKAVFLFNLEEFFRWETLAQGSGRTQAWKHAMKEINSSFSSFTFGQGFNYTENLFKEDFRVLSQKGHLGNAHQSFLTFWLDTGIIGLILYCVAFLTLFFRMARKSVLAFPIFYAIVFSVSFESWLTASLNPFTILFIMILTVLSLGKENKEELVEENPVST